MSKGPLKGLTEGCVSAGVHSGVDLADWACSWATKKGALRAEWHARLYYNMCARYRANLMAGASCVNLLLLSRVTP